MISEKDKNKLKFDILGYLNYHFHKTSDPNVDLIIFTVSAAKDGFDEHDVELALNDLKADKFIETSISDNPFESFVSITEKGCIFYKENHENKIIKYLKQNHLAVIAIIVSIIFGILGVIF